MALLLAPLFLAALAQAQTTTTTATILLPDWCVTQSAPTVTILAQDTLTTYSYGCSVDSSDLARASSAVNEAQSKMSKIQASLTNVVFPTNTPGLGKDENKRDWDWDASEYSCLANNQGAFEACIPWEVTQGASYWAVHYTASDVIGIEQECTFGDGGVASGPATCTASGRLDPSIWVDNHSDGKHTQTFSPSEVERYWFKDTVTATAGGPPATTGVFATKVTGTAAAAVAAAGAESTGVAVPRSMPTGVVAMMAGAGGILAAALAL